MGTTMVRTIKSGVAIALLLGASVAAQPRAWASSRSTRRSARSLNAEIDLVSLQPGELESLTARVALRRSLPRRPHRVRRSLRLLRFSVEKRPTASRTSRSPASAPINEPFVDVLIEVTWPAGRIQREYPILLDPPGYSAAAVAAASGAAAASSAAAARHAAGRRAGGCVFTAPTCLAHRWHAARRPRSAELPRRPAAPPQPARSDTLRPGAEGRARFSKIAERGEALGREHRADAGRALSREPRRAFVGNNMNRLKAGPDPQGAVRADEVSADRADRTRTRKSARTSPTGRRIANSSRAASRRIPPRAESHQRRDAAAIASAAVTPPAPPSPASRGRRSSFQVRYGGKAAAPARAAAPTGRASTPCRKRSPRRTRRCKESQSRVADLEKQIRDMQRLLDLKAGAPAQADADTKAAAARARRRREARRRPEPSPKAESPPKPPKPAAKPRRSPSRRSADTERRREAPKPAERRRRRRAKPEAPKADAAQGRAEEGRRPPPRDWIDELLDNPAVPRAGGGAPCGIWLGGFLFVRRRKGGAEAGPSQRDDERLSLRPQAQHRRRESGRWSGGHRQQLLPDGLRQDRSRARSTPTRSTRSRRPRSTSPTAATRRPRRSSRRRWRATRAATRSR